MIALDERLIPTRTPLTPARLRALVQALRAGGMALRALPPAARVDAVDRVAASWLADDSPWRQRALSELPMSTGYPPAAIAIALENLWNALRGPYLTSALQVEVAPDEIGRASCRERV